MSIFRRVQFKYELCLGIDHLEAYFFTLKVRYLKITSVKASILEHRKLGLVFIIDLVSFIYFQEIQSLIPRVHSLEKQLINRDLTLKSTVYIGISNHGENSNNNA